MTAPRKTTQERLEELKRDLRPLLAERAERAAAHAQAVADLQEQHAQRGVS